jgi:hypothetical protein
MAKLVKRQHRKTHYYISDSEGRAHPRACWFDERDGLSFSSKSLLHHKTFTAAFGSKGVYRIPKPGNVRIEFEFFENDWETNNQPSFDITALFTKMSPNRARAPYV